MTYFVTYISSIDDDCCTVWTEASSKEEAKESVFNEYQDIKEILIVRKGKQYGKRM